MALQNTELQQDLQRYAAQFSERVTQAMGDLERSPSPTVSDAALKRNLLYASSAVDIATGSFPEVNLLDMIVFVRLSRAVLEQYWIPEVYGPDAKDLSSVFEKSEDELWCIAERILDEPRRRELKDLIDQWHVENPKQV